MKKSFLIVSALGAIIATSGYAVQSGGIVVTFKCPDGCLLETYQDGSTFGAHCRNPRTREFCSGPTVVSESGVSADVMHEIEKMEKLDKTNATKQTKKTNTARAAKIGKNVNTADIPSTPMGAKAKASVGSEETHIMCHGDCKLDCHTNPSGTSMLCKCKKPNGEICQESVDIFQPESHK